MENDILEMPARPSSVLRSLTVRNNATRAAVNFMPSRQINCNTLRLRRVNSENNALLDDEPDIDTVDGGEPTDRQADIIVRELESHQRLMEDDPQAEEMRREALRDLPQGLTIKRSVRAKLSTSVSLRSKRRPISLLKRLKYRISFGFKRFQDRLRDLVFSIELWYEAIRNIEGHFGSAVGSYFHFLRWMFCLNVLLSIFIVCFVVVPQALHERGLNTTSPQEEGRGFLDFVSGKGSYEESLLFYGHYHDGDISTSGAKYSQPFAYFFTVVCVCVATFAVLLYRTAYSYRRNFIETSGGGSHSFANKVFCGWDFGIATSHAARLTAAAVCSEFKELLSEINKKQVNSTLLVKIWQYLTNTIVTALVLGFIIGIEIGFWRLLTLETKAERWEILVSLVITVAVALCPLVFDNVVRLEFYNRRTALYVTLARTWLFDISTLMLILYYWSNSDTHCWETSLGQETYRLVLLDTLISLILLPAIEGTRGLLFKLNYISTPPEFNIAYNSLTLIYNQAVVWFGLMFCPLLVVCVTIKLLVLFYLKREVALRACQPATKVWRASQTQTILYMLVTLSLFTMLFGVGLYFSKTSSHHCGPFRQYEYVYSIVTQGVLNLSEHHRARTVLTFLMRPGFIGFVMLFLGVCVYYMRARARAQQSMVGILRQMLVLQAKDKDFLLNAIAKVSNGEWLYSPKPTEDHPDSHTWKYLQEVRKPSNVEFHFDVSRLNHSYAVERPRSYVKDRAESSHSQKMNDDGDTDSSFSWKGSGGGLNASK